MPGGACSTTKTSPSPSSTASSSVGGSSRLTDRPCVPNTLGLTMPCHPRPHINWPEFPELTGQSFRNPQEGRRAQKLVRNQTQIELLSARFQTPSRSNSNLKDTRTRHPAAQSLELLLFAGHGHPGVPCLVRFHSPG